jgi:CDP-diacylglycerol--serine O-phosphatidyltransferase
VASVTFSSVVALYNLRVLGRRHFADMLSLGNLLCGVGVAFHAAHHRLDLALLWLAGSILCDGFDGAAARRWGGSRLGMLADDFADGFSFGIAPGFALFATFGGVTGAVVGVLYAAMVILRLVHFTLRAKSGGDAAGFAGVPSTVGAVVTMCALRLFPDPLVAGLLVGMVVVFMTTFGQTYPHLGRLMNRKRLGFCAGAVLLVIGSGWVHPALPAAGALAIALAFAFAPTAAGTWRLWRGGSGRTDV